MTKEIASDIDSEVGEQVSLESFCILCINFYRYNEVQISVFAINPSPNDRF